MVCHQYLKETLKNGMTMLAEGGKGFFIEKKDGTKWETFFTYSGEIHGNRLYPHSKRKEKRLRDRSRKTIVDYLFLSKEIVRVQAISDVR